MTAYLEHLRGGDDVVLTGLFEPTQSASTLILWECDETGGVDGDGNPISWVPTYKTADEVVTALANNDLRFRAAIGLPFEEYNGSSYIPVTKGTEFGPMLVRSLTVEEHPNKANAWQITIQESSMGNLLDSNGSAQGSPAISVNVSSRTRNVDAWRVGPVDLPRDGDQLNPDYDFYFDGSVYQACDSSQSIGGFGVDVNGNPLKTSVEQNQITIEYIVRSPYKQWDGSYKQDGEVAQYLNALALGNTVGARNAEQLWYFPMGTLRCTDVAIQPLHHEFKRVIWTLIADEWSHAEQRPWLGKQGVNKTIEAPCNVENGNSPIFLADAVFWRQPYLEAFSMGENPEGYFPAGGWDAVWAKFGTDPSTYTPAYPSGGD